MLKNILGLVFILVLFLTGCTDEGTLRISNLDADYGWFKINHGLIDELNPGDSYEKSYDLSTSIFGDEDKKVTVEYGGEYVFDESVEKTIKPGSTKTVEFETNAGSIRIINDTSDTSIWYVYISPSSSSEWGDDLLGNEILSPDYYISWLVTPGLWDVWFIDEDGYDYTFMNQQIDLGTTSEYTFTDAKRSFDPISEKITNSQKYSEKVEGKCRRK